MDARNLEGGIYVIVVKTFVGGLYIKDFPYKFSVSNWQFVLKKSVTFSLTYQTMQGMTEFTISFLCKDRAKGGFCLFFEFNECIKELCFPIYIFIPSTKHTCNLYVCILPNIQKG